MTERVYFLDTFAGMAGLRIGLEDGLASQAIEAQCVGTSEIKTHALNTLAHLYPDEQFEYTDITQLDTDDIPHIDALIGGFPCFPAGEQITTDEGYKDIKDIQVGDMVLTHTNKFQRVLHTMQRETHGMYHLHARGSHHTPVTGEHPYYVRYFSEAEFKLGEPRWIEVKDFLGTEYIGYAINKKRSNPYKLTLKQAKELGHLYALDFNEAHHYLDELALKNEELKQLIRESIGNILPDFIINLPINLLKPFFTTYLATQNTGRDVVYAQNRDNAYILAQIILKVYKKAYTVTFRGHDWEVDFSTETNTDWYYVDEQVWQRIDRVGYDPHHVETVYNFEVEEDNSYVVNNVIVHNCQPFSMSGKRLGLEDTRGTLFYDLARILKDKQPRFAIFENVQGLVHHDKGRTLPVIIETFESMGYHVSYKMFNSADYGCAGTRKRLFIVCHKDFTVDLERIPKLENGPVLKDIMEHGVPTSQSEYTQNLLKAFEVEDLYGRTIGDKKGGQRVVKSWQFEARGEVSDLQAEVLTAINKLQANSRRFKEYGSTVPISYLQREFSEIEPDELKELLDDLLEKKYLRTEKDGVRLLFGQLSGEFTRILDPDKKINTFTATDLSRMAVPVDNGLRSLTIKECLRALGFPKDYTFPETVSINNQYDLIGNTVAPPVAQYITETIIEQEREYNKKKGESSTWEREKG